MNKIQKLQNLIIIILIVVIGYLFYQIVKIKEEIAFNYKIIEAHQYNIDLKQKQINDLHKISLEIIEATGIKVNNEISIDPYKGIE